MLEVVGWYGDREVVPLLRRYVRYEWPRQYYASEDEEYVRQIKRYNERVRLKAAAALLALGDADTALPVLEELAKEGKTAALGYIFHNMIGTKWQARGIAIIRKALEYKNNESKALAALFLIRLTKEGYVKEDLNKLKEVLINLSEDILEKKKWDINIHGYNDRRVLGTVITALKELKSKEAIPVLERIANHPDASYLKQWVNEAIEAIDVSSSKKEGEDE
ncbi:MAG TPA: HEAT repeat domain-containing protein [Nitrospirae bacterium]|nr:HEAT repeat domain-containing protein [Nitrospirota bacterium]